MESKSTGSPAQEGREYVDKQIAQVRTLFRERHGELDRMEAEAVSKLDLYGKNVGAAVQEEKKEQCCLKCGLLRSTCEMQGGDKWVINCQDVEGNKHCFDAPPSPQEGEGWEEKLDGMLKEKIIDHAFDGSCLYNENEGGKGHKECRFPYNPGRKNPSGEQCLRLKEDHLDLKSFIRSLLASRDAALMGELEDLFQDERPMEDGVPVETYGYEKAFNSGIRAAIALVRSNQKKQ